MLDSWNNSIFCNIKKRLQDSAMKLVYSERNGEAFDSQLVIGVRESYGRLYPCALYLLSGQCYIIAFLRFLILYLVHVV